MKLKSLKRRLSEMSSKERIKWFLRFVISVLCVTGLIFQAILLVYQYRSRQTVVNVKIEMTKFNKIPALTICYPSLVSMETAAQKYPQLQPLLDYYNSLLSQRTVNESDESVSRAVGQSYNNFSSLVDDLDLSVNQLLDVSIPFEYRGNPNPLFAPISWLNITTAAIKTIVNGIRYFRDNGSMDEIELQDVSPIESVVVGKEQYKCFTFFHHLKRDYRTYQMDVKEILIDIYHNEHWFPSQIYNESPEGEKKFLMFSMHSPESFPQQMNVNNFLRLKAGKWYEITYNRLKTVLLESPYKTDCYKYNIDDEQGHRLRSDCVNDCIYNNLYKNCSQWDRIGSNADRSNRTECFYVSPSVWRRVIIQKDNKTFGKLCNSSENHCFDRNFNRVHRQCEVDCQPECTNRFYNYNMKTNKKLPEPKVTQIRIAHNQLPDQVTEHIPEMTFIQFMANFGGLLGMWMGLSAFVISHYIIKQF